MSHPATDSASARLDPGTTTHIALSETAHTELERVAEALLTLAILTERNTAGDVIQASEVSPLLLVLGAHATTALAQAVTVNPRRAA